MIAEKIANGQKFDFNCLLTSEGIPSNDPLEVRDKSGTVLPVGGMEYGHKGYGLALAVDMLSGVLSGGSYSSLVRSQFFEPEKPSGICHYFIGVDPDKLIGLELFQDRLEDYCNWIKEQPIINPKVPVRVPGERAAEAFAENIDKGILVDPNHHKRNQGLAKGTIKGVIPAG